MSSTSVSDICLLLEIMNGCPGWVSILLVISYSLKFVLRLLLENVACHADGKGMQAVCHTVAES